MDPTLFTPALALTVTSLTNTDMSQSKTKKPSRDISEHIKRAVNARPPALPELGVTT